MQMDVPSSPYTNTNTDAAIRLAADENQISLSKKKKKTSRLRFCFYNIIIIMAVISKREWNIAILQVVLVLVITPGTILVFQPLADLFVDAVDELLSTDPDVFSEFDDSCYMVTQREYKKELLDLEGVFTDDDTVDDDDGTLVLKFRMPGFNLSGFCSPFIIYDVYPLSL